MIDERKAVKPSGGIHNIILESRRRLSISGITDFESFNDEAVLLQTEMGTLEIRGEDLHMNKLSLESGEVVIEGGIIGMMYTDDLPKDAKGGLFSKLFR